MAYTAGDAVKIFSAKDPKEPIFLVWVERQDIVSQLDGFEAEDKEGNQIEIEKFVTTDYLESVFSSLGDDDYLWERFNESVSDIVYDLMGQEINEMNKVKEDTELWDTEQE